MAVAAAHGGANEAVIKMLRDIGSKDRIPAAIARAKDKSDSFRLMGFGHRSGCCIPENTQFHLHHGIQRARFHWKHEQARQAKSGEG